MLRNYWNWKILRKPLPKAEQYMDKITVACSKINYLSEGQTTDMANVLTIQNLVYEPLVRMDSGEIRPALASSWQALDNGCRWIFYIRDNASFSDGSACTSADIIRSLELAKNVTDSFGMPGPFTKYLADLTFSAPGNKCIQVTCTEPNGDLLDFLSEIYIQKPGNGPEPLGTGPYRIESLETGKALRLKYRGSSEQFCAFDVIDFIEMPDTAERMAALQQGRIHLASEMDDIAPLPENSASDSVRWIYAVNTLSVTGFLNGFDKPFSSPVARQAVNYAVNKQRIIQEIYHGLGIPASTVVSPYHCGFESSLQAFPFDPDKAMELFDKCGVSNQITIRTPQVIPAHGEEIAGLIRDDLEAIGFKVTIDVQTDRPAYAKEASQKKIGDLGLFDSSPHSVYRVLYDKISSRIHSTWWQGVSDEEADRLIDAAHAEADQCRRREAYARVLRRLNEIPAWLYLFHPINAFAGKPGITDNIQLTHSGLLRFPGTW